MNNRYIYYEQENAVTGDMEWLVFDQTKGTGVAAWTPSEKKAKRVAIALNLLDTFEDDLR